MKRTLLIAISTVLSVLAAAQKKAMPASSLFTGKQIYTKHCMTCHQVDGVGAPNMIPPLIKTDYVLGSKERLIKILLNGMKGEIKVNGDLFAGEMPSQALLKDAEIAAVLSYVRKSFGNNATAVTISEVKKVRATNKK